VHVTPVNDLATHTTAVDASFDVAARSDIVPADVVATNIVDCDVRDGCRSASVTSADADCSQTDDVITTQLVDSVIDDKTADRPQVTSLGFSQVTPQLTGVTAVEKLVNSDAELLLRAVEQSEKTVVVDVVNSPPSTATINVTSAEVKEQIVDNGTLEELVFDDSLSKRDVENDVGETESGRASLSTAAQGEDEEEMDRDGDGQKGGDSPLAEGAEEAMDIDDDDAYYSGSTVSSSFDHQSTTSSSADEPKNNTGDHAR
jgi:hypothetical protein